MRTLNRNAALYSPGAGFSRRISACEKPLSTTISATAAMAVRMPHAPRSEGVRCLRTRMLTPACSSIEATFSPTLHAMLRATLCLSSLFTSGSFHVPPHPARPGIRRTVRSRRLDAGPMPQRRNAPIRRPIRHAARPHAEPHTGSPAASARRLSAQGRCCEAIASLRRRMLATFASST